MALRPIEGGPCIPVAIIRNEASSGGTTTVSDPTLLTELQKKADLTETQPVLDSALLTELQKKADLTETQPILPVRKELAATDSHAPADNTAAVLDYTGVMAVAHVVGQITWSYDADPTGGNLKIENSSATVFTIPITKGGPGQLTFNPPITTGIAQDLTITLAAGGGTVQGAVNAVHWLEA